MWPTVMAKDSVCLSSASQGIQFEQREIPLIRYLCTKQVGIFEITNITNIHQQFVQLAALNFYMQYTPLPGIVNMHVDIVMYSIPGIIDVLSTSTYLPFMHICIRRPARTYRQMYSRVMLTVASLVLWVVVAIWVPASARTVEHVSHNNFTVELEAVYQTVPSDRLWNAIQKVETGGVYDPEIAVGDHGAAIGPLQIHRVYYNDAVQFDPSLQSGQYNGYTYDKCMGPGSFEYSKKVGDAYMARYATAKRLGHTPTDEDFARIHNGGPNGWKSRSTLGYWQKVQAVLNSQ